MMRTYYVKFAGNEYVFDGKKAKEEALKMVKHLKKSGVKYRYYFVGNNA